MKQNKFSKFILSTVLCILLFSIIFFNKQIVQYIMVNVIYQKQIVLEDVNEYEKPYDYEYIQRTNSFKPQNKQDLWNIIYTVLNNGWNHFTFYCNPEYKDCIKDVDELTQNNEILSNMNNFVHPFNSFDRLYISTNSFGKIEIDVEKTYSEDMILKINEQVNQILKEEIEDSMTDKEKIKAIHDYIINHTQYDMEHANILEQHLDQEPTYQSNTAYGTLLNGKAICGGYTDTMAIFLNRLNINNYKISSLNHVWNYVELDHQWYHLDLTWDDPVVNTKEDILLHDFFLITTEELITKDTNQHNYDENVFIEAKSK